MASAVYSSYVRDADINVLRQNLFMMRSAIQHFYLDIGRHPIANGIDLCGNKVSFLDTTTSELVQGACAPDPTNPRKRLAAQRHRYLLDVPIDPTTNLANWRLYVEKAVVDEKSGRKSDVVTNVASTNPEFADL
jgi:hypothetical protein